MQGEFWIINSEEKLSNAITELRDMWNLHRWVTVQFKSGKTRTAKQNASLHLYLRMLANELNERGITFEQFFKEGFQVPWTDKIVKDNVWRPLQEAVTGEGKTSKASRRDYSKVYDPLNEKLASFGIHVPWPEKEQLYAPESKPTAA